MVCSTLM